MMLNPVQTPEQAVIDRQHLVGLARYLGRLPARRERVIRMHYGIGCEPMTLREIGKSMGITGSAVNAIEWKALRTLRRIMLKEFYPKKHALESAQRTAQHRIQVERDKENAIAAQKRHEAEQEARWLERQRAQNWGHRPADPPPERPRFIGKSFEQQARECRAMEAMLQAQWRATHPPIVKRDWLFVASEAA
jgi:hypothetical protein